MVVPVSVSCVASIPHVTPTAPLGATVSSANTYRARARNMSLA